MRTLSIYVKYIPTMNSYIIKHHCINIICYSNMFQTSKSHAQAVQLIHSSSKVNRMSCKIQLSAECGVLSSRNMIRCTLSLILNLVTHAVDHVAGMYQL